MLSGRHYKPKKEIFIPNLESGLPKEEIAQLSISFSRQNKPTKTDRNGR